MQVRHITYVTGLIEWHTLKPTVKKLFTTLFHCKALLGCEGATQLSIQVADGGLKLLQIKDNGCGIHAEDFPILCRRHTTSKLSNHEDLKHISTLGFRGEALCSISFVSRLRIVSMRAGESMGYKADFRDSEMTTEEPERCAAVQGTCITAEDMFYNVPNRKKALSSPSQEFRLMYDVIAKYAVYSTGVTLSCIGHSLRMKGHIHWTLTSVGSPCWHDPSRVQAYSFMHHSQQRSLTGSITGAAASAGRMCCITQEL